MIQIEVKGLTRMRRFIVSLSRELNVEIMKGNEDFIKRVQKSAKLRAPRSPGGGELARSIIVRKIEKRIVLSATAPYAYFQEFGYRPHWIHSDMNNRMGRLIGGIYNFKGFMYVRRHKPFFTPALESNLNYLVSIMSRRVHQAIIKSRR